MLAYFVHGLTLTLSWFLVANIVASVVVAAIASRVVRRTRSANTLFALRVAPAALAAAFVVAAFVPSYWIFEPRESVEGFDVTLTIGAMVAGIMIASGIVRGAAAWLAVRRRTRAWSDGTAPMPLMALVGIVRPRVFVSPTLIETLTPDELSATLAHEMSHWHSRDNLKRLAMRTAPDFLFGTSVARDIERAWASAAEQVADDAGGGRDATARCTLASALVKVARLMPETVAPLEPISTLVGGGELTSRVRRLLDEPPPDAHRSRTRVAAVVAGIAALVALYGPLLHAVHEASEILVNSLP